MKLDKCHSNAHIVSIENVHCLYPGLINSLVFVTCVVHKLARSNLYAQSNQAKFEAQPGRPNRIEN